MSNARIHPTAIIEEGVAVGDLVSVWSHVHIRGPETSIGAESIVGEKSYIAYGVSIGSRVKINAMVYICTAVTIDDGVMIGAGTVFTNDRFPRATTSDLSRLLPSEPDEKTRPTRIRQGASIGAGSVIGSDLEVGRFAMVGMGSVVTRPVPDFGLVVGNPARLIGFVCRCGEPLVRFRPGDVPPNQAAINCPACSLPYSTQAGILTEAESPSFSSSE